MSEIRLHPEKGVNPRLTVCRACGKDVGLVLLGAHDYVTTCPSCNKKLIGGGKCPKCHVMGVNKVRLPGGLSLPIELCDDCQKKHEETVAAVKDGGIFWRCTDCGSEGAIRKNAPLAQEVRTKMGIEPPGLCGIEFNKNERCPVCSKDAIAAEVVEEEEKEKEDEHKLSEGDAVSKPDVQ